MGPPHHHHHVCECVHYALKILLLTIGGCCSVCCFSPLGSFCCESFLQDARLMRQAGLKKQPKSGTKLYILQRFPFFISLFYLQGKQHEEWLFVDFGILKKKKK